MTASKAIIEKEYQPKVVVSKQGPNPFTKLTDQELEEYRKEVEQKQKGTEGKADEWMRESKCGNKNVVGFRNLYTKHDNMMIHNEEYIALLLLMQINEFNIISMSG